MRLLTFRIRAVYSLLEERQKSILLTLFESFPSHSSVFSRQIMIVPVGHHNAVITKSQWHIALVYSPTGQLEIISSKVGSAGATLHCWPDHLLPVAMAEKQKETSSCTSTLQASLMSYMLTSLSKASHWPGPESSSRKIYLPSPKGEITAKDRMDSSRVGAISSLPQSASHQHLYRISSVYFCLPMYFELALHNSSVRILFLFSTFHRRRSNHKGKVIYQKSHNQLAVEGEFSTFFYSKQSEGKWWTFALFGHN